MADLENEEALAEAVRAGVDTIEVPEELVTESDQVEKSLLLRLQDMTVGERIKLALRGNREARTLLLRDSNRLIQRLVLENPRIGEDEIIALARNRTIDDGILRIIAAKREWMENYQVRLALVTNPKTPVVTALRLLGGLQERDVRALAKSKNVSGTIASRAKRVVAEKYGRSG